MRLRWALREMDARHKAGASAEVIRLGVAHAVRWKGNAHFYGRMAGAYWDMGQWKKAVANGRRALALDSSQVQTVTFMLAAYRELNPAAGIVFGERWLKKHSGNASVYRHLSFLYDDLRRRDEALAAARRGFTYHPRDRQLAACIANYLAKVEGAESALRFAKAHPKFFTNDVYCENTLADGLSSRGAYHESAKIFDGLYRRNPGNARILVSLLDAWYHQGRYAEVVAEVERWQARELITAPLANELGRALLELGRNEEGLKWIARAMELAPGNMKYADNHAVALGNAGRHAEGIAACEQRLASANSPDRARLLISLGVDHTWLRRHADALPYYQQAFAEFPENDDALVNLMVGYTWLQRWTDAIALGQAHQQSRGPTIQSRFWQELSWALHQEKRFAEEEKTIAEWGRLYPDDRDVVRTMKRVLNHLDRRGDALAFVRQWVDAHPGVAGGWRYLAEQHEVCGNADDEMAAIAEACRLAPDDSDLADAHLVVLRRRGRWKECLQEGIAWERAHPRGASASLLNRIGLVADDLEDWPVAEEYYRRAHELDPGEGVWIGNRIRALIHLKRSPEALELGRAWLASNPPDNYVILKQAWALREAGSLTDETELLRKAIEFDAKDEELRYALLTNLIARKSHEEAAALVAQCETAGIATSRMINDWSLSLLDEDRHEQAETGYRRALELDPNNRIPAGNLVSLLTGRNRTDEAREFALNWLARRPEDHYVRRQLANVYYTIDDFPPGEEEYRRLVAIEPDSPFLFGRLIACLRLGDKFAEALDLAKPWLEKHTGTPFLYTELGIAAYRLGRGDESLRHYETALSLDGSSLPAALRKLRVLDEQGPPAVALKFGSEWAVANHADSQFENELAIVADKAGDLNQAQRRFLRAVELDPDNPTLAGNAVEILCRRGEVVESIQLGQRLLANSPPNAYLLRRLAESYSEHHEYIPALDLLSSADALEPGDVDVAVRLMRVAYESGEIERGLEFGRAWLARPGNERRAAVWGQFARLCFRGDFDDEAFKAVQTATEIQPDEIGHLRLRFNFVSALENDNQLTIEYRDVRPEWRHDPQLMRYVSEANHRLGFAGEALELAMQNVAANPGDADAAAWLAELHLKNDRRDEARDYLRVWMATHGEQWELVKVRARLALKDEHYPAALADAENILAQNPSDEDAFVICIKALRATGQGAQARSRLHRWIEHERMSSRISSLLDEER